MPTLTKENRRYLITYETLNAITHGLGVIAAIVGATLLIVNSVQHGFSTFTIVALSIYALSIISFLLASTLFHALIFTKAGKIFQFLDHSGIYLVILGSYTPYTWLFLDPKIGWPIWGTILSCTLLGLIYDTFFVGRWPFVSVIIYVLMGWFIILALPALYGALSSLAFYLLLAGGITYTAGSLLYLMPKIPLNHVYWHLFVLVGATLMYLSIYDTLFH
ncbi:hemolysin III family protein [Weissella sagaensis]|uniref:Hemolysin III family protein n=1 Tax=Weissella sagaensis TaxID=2559928 RepID=A0ABW1RU08_9LACO|nr:hemolysin III family protein [Weissella sagaensis]KAA8433273.1 hemolysin III [Weissella paramesenteroides]MBU7567197.1 hemolysin III family protein [Weissella hellenica]KAA8439297.1 hemolysin III [Weissella paramesenteroides]QDJ59252.1 hemolysin III [Weissella hellenica]QEA56547.1 hemolysin III [Weissella hellenica]